MKNNDAVIVSYANDVPGVGSAVGHLSGERYEVASAEAAALVHPDATILRYADGRRYTPESAPSTAIPSASVDSSEGAGEAEGDVKVGRRGGTVQRG